MQLGDLRLAEMLAERAVAAGGGLPAKIIQAMAITWQERGADAEVILAELAGETRGPTRAQIAILRAMNFALSLGDAASAERELDEAIPADDEAAQAVANALRALIDLVRGHSRAVDRASTILASTPANDIVQMLSIWVLVTGLGDLGRIDEIESAADAGYQLAETSAEASHLRLPLAAVQVIAYRLAGALTSLDAMIARIGRDTIDVPFQQAWHSLFAGLSAMSRGDLPAAQRSLQEAIAHLENGGGGRMTKTFARSWLAAVTAYGRQSSRRATGARGHRAIRPGTPRQACGTSSDSLPRRGRVPPKALRRRRSRSSVTQRRKNPSAAGPPGKSCSSRRRHNSATTPPPRDWRSWPASSRAPAQPLPRLMPPHLRREAETHSSTRHASTRHSAIASPPPTPQPTPSSPTKMPACAARH